MTPSNAGLGPQVKPLEWEESEGPLKGQKVWSAGDPWLFWIVKNPNSPDYVWCETLHIEGFVPASPVRGSFGTLEEAKAAAQADFDARVRAAIDQSHLLRSLEEAREALKPFAVVTDRPYFKHVHDEQRLFIETNAEVVISEDVRGRDFRRARAALASLSQADAGRGE